ncbi:hypothetical protein VIGAN_10228900 [Vigna angularis var. angularis]|uniref:Protein kinase domain-containing protein n=1 Tax=Vigna angularis var. angularis TaxID=157739 RepID=A0A0S3T6W4_PHAAN|nr:hypothetical protein VIGAN_10228900 [Vigna angularis var. angularis]
MGCICSKENKDKVDEYEKEKEREKESNKSSVQLVAPSVSTAQSDSTRGTDGSVPLIVDTSTQAIRGSVVVTAEDKSNHSDATQGQQKRRVTVSCGVDDKMPMMSRILSVQHIAGEQVDSGWPIWLSSVAAEAIKGWVPRRADSFEKLGQVGQGAYSSVHKARDLETGKIVALKKVRFSSADVESVRFMAREIYIMRQLDHPNVMKLEGLVTSRTSTSLYLVFEYMEHDLAGLATVHGLKLTESQVEQMHKIFKLCGSPSEDYWQRTKFPHATSFKPQHPYNRQISETFEKFSSTALALVDKLLTIEPEARGSATSALESEFFTTNPLPCEPSSLPKFSPSKEFDSKRRQKEATRKNQEAVRGRAPASVLRGAGDTKALGSPQYNAQGNISMLRKPNSIMCRQKYLCQENREAKENGEGGRVSVHGGFTHAATMTRGSVAGSSTLSKRVEPSLKNQRSHLNPATADLCTSALKKEPDSSAVESTMGYMPKKNRIHYSGPLMPPGGNLDDMLREHEKLMQDVFRSVKKANL